MLVKCVLSCSLESKCLIDRLFREHREGFMFMLNVVYLSIGMLLVMLVGI